MHLLWIYLFGSLLQLSFSLLLSIALSRFSWFSQESLWLHLLFCIFWGSKKLNGNYTRMLWAIVNKSLKKHSTKQQLYGHLSPIMKTIQIKWTIHVGYCWRSKDELISNVLLVGRPARTYIQQLCADTGCSLEDHLGAMDNIDGWWEGLEEPC